MLSKRRRGRRICDDEAPDSVSGALLLQPRFYILNCRSKCDLNTITVRNIPHWLHHPRIPAKVLKH